MKKLFLYMLLGLLWCNVGFAATNNNLIYIKCYINKWNWPYIKIDLDKKQIAYLIKTKPGHFIVSDWPREEVFFKITKVTDELIVGKKESISYDITYDDGSVYQANDTININRIIGSARLGFTTLKDTRKDDTPEPYVFVGMKYWEAQDCEPIEYKAKF